MIVKGLALPGLSISSVVPVGATEGRTEVIEDYQVRDAVNASPGVYQPLVQVRDLLVTAGTLGHAMKRTERGRMVGAIIGKALEEFAGPGTGVIEVMVNVK